MTPSTRARPLVFLATLIVAACAGQPEPPPTTQVEQEIRCPGGFSCTSTACRTATCGDQSCEFDFQPDGTGCNDGNACSQSSSCQAGRCVGFNFITCPPTGDPCANNSCQPSTGQCAVSPAPDGQACDDGNACTSGTVCAGGVCNRGTLVTCPPPDVCHTAVCHPPDGSCTPLDNTLCQTPPTWPVGASLTAVVTGPSGVMLTWSPATHPQGTSAFNYNVYGNASLVATVSGSTTATTLSNLTTTTIYYFHVEARTLVGVETNVGPGTDFSFPGMTVDAAPPFDLTRPVTMTDESQFLYTGVSPVQTGVNPAAIDPARVAVVRGRVSDIAGAPLIGVSVSVAGHPELGTTTTQANGVFSMAVNGGGALRLRYAKTGYLGAERHLDVPWSDFGWAPAVTLLAPDAAVTTVSNNAASAQVARGSVMSDADGSRRATVYVPAGTVASWTKANGGIATPTGFHVRATEYTVGPRGPSAMPADLPPTSGYTYAVSLNVDEADADGATQVTFSQPLALYVENFVNFTVGDDAPAGSYDTFAGAWIPGPSGKVVKLLSRSSGLANLDTDGDGQPDASATYTALGISDVERQQIALLYSDGTTFWRVPIAHFSGWDVNWGYGPPDDATDWRKNPRKRGLAKHPCPDQRNTACDDQAPRVNFGLTGTGTAIQYSGDRAVSRIAERTLDIPLSGDSIPPDLSRIDLVVDVAGQETQLSFAPQTNLDITYTWDGNDGFGRALTGRQRAIVKVRYIYPIHYGKTPRFGYSGAGLGVDINATRRFGEIALDATHVVAVERTLSAQGAGFGGWTVDAQHMLDLNAGILYRGDGGRQALGGQLRVVAGCGFCDQVLDPHFTGDATGVTFTPQGLAVAPDGTVYVADPNTYGQQVRRITPDGQISTFAGNGTPGFSGDEGPATNAQLSSPVAVAVAPDGSVYIADQANARVRRVDPAGVIHTVLTVTPSDADRLIGLAASPSGGVYVASLNVIRFIDPAGATVVVAGNGTNSPPPQDNVPATSSPIQVSGFALGPDGSLFFGAAGKIYRVLPGGLLRKFAGSGDSGPVIDGTTAIDHAIGRTDGLAVGRDGTVYMTDSTGAVVRHILSDGTIEHIMGIPGDGGPATAAGNIIGDALDSWLHLPFSLAVGPDGLYVGETLGGRPRILRFISARFVRPGSVLYVPSRDASEVYVFDSSLRHVRTAGALTGDTLLTFNYTNGLVSSIDDGQGNVTTYDRSVSGHIRVVAPFGQTTDLAFDDLGRLISSTDPTGMVTTVTYVDATDLIHSVSHPTSGTQTYGYEPDGTLKSITYPNGGVQQFTTTADDASRTVTNTSPLGRTTQYNTITQAAGTNMRNVTYAGHTATETSQGGRKTVGYPDQSTVTVATGPDPRFGMDAPVVKSFTVTTPGGPTLTASTSRAVTTSDRGNPLSVTGATYTVTVNGNTWTSVYDASTRKVTATSPQGRQVVSQLDARGRVVSVAVPGVDPVVYHYNARGQLDQTSQGNATETRQSTMAYDNGGLLHTLTVGAEIAQYLYDLIARPTTLTRPDSKSIGVVYSTDGRTVSVTAPSQSQAHVMNVNPEMGTAGYTPPLLAGTTGPERLSRLTLDEALDSVAGRGSTTLASMHYDTAGRLDTITVDGQAGSTSYGYDNNSGLLTTALAPSGESTVLTFQGPLLATVAQSGPVGGAIGYTYNNDYRLGSETVGGASIAYGYEPDGNLVSAGSLSLGRDPQNALVTSATMGQVVTTFTPNHFGDVDGSSTTAGGTAIYSTQVTQRDPQGRVRQRTETIQGTAHAYAYTFDLAGRLTDVSVDGSLVSHYTYDDNGNRQTGPVAGATYGYDAQDRLKTLTSSAGTTSYDYTDDGRLKQRTDPSGTWTFSYDFNSTLLQVVTPAKTIAYVVDAAGHRIGRKVGGTFSNKWLWGGAAGPLAELDANNNVVSRFVYAERGWVPSYMVKGGHEYRFLTDAIGSVRLVIDAANGQVAERIDYDEFGNVTADSNPGFQPFGFGGGLYDQDTRLVRFGARDYDPSLGRWTTKDPLLLGGGSTNVYLYASGDPINRTDPSGLIDHEFWANLAAGAGDVILPFGIGQWLREKLGVDDFVDTCSNAYGTAHLATSIGMIVLPLAGPPIARLLGKVVGAAADGAVVAEGAAAAGGTPGVILNLGGEGEVAGAINFQGKWVLDPAWRSSANGQTLRELQAAGNQFVVGSNTAVPFQTGSVPTVITNSVPIDTTTWLGPGVQSSEVWRILAPNGKWINNGVVVPRP
jgi:RHS repeat-associated protein